MKSIAFALLVVLGCGRSDSKNNNAAVDGVVNPGELGPDHTIEAGQDIANLGERAFTTGVVNPGERGPDHTIEAGQDIANLGEWEFTTNMTSINMGAGMSTRGRLLQARQGAWRLTLSVYIAPDPGADKLDTQMADLARTVVAKLK